jgi:MoxR-like ATPase
MHPVAKKLNVIGQEIGDIYFERESLIEAIMLGLLSALHVYILGEPGTGKTELAWEALGRITGDPLWTGPAGEAGRIRWRQQLTKFTPLEKMFGGLDVPALREKGEYHHNIKGFLPTTRYALLDEIGKCNPAALGALLAATNERLFDNNAETMEIALMTLIACSNEELTEEEENAAIWDRMHLRVSVDYIKDPSNFTKLLQLATTRRAPRQRTTIDFAELQDAIVNEVPNIVVPAGIHEAVLQLREQLRREGLRPSDRRMYQGIPVMQAGAFLNGRSQVEDDDLAALRFLFWETSEEITKVERAVMTLSNPTTKEALDILDAVEEIASEIASKKGQSQDELSTYGVRANGKLKSASVNLDKLRKQAQSAGRSTTKLDEVQGRIAAVKRIVGIECLGWTREDFDGRS